MSVLKKIKTFCLKNSHKAHYKFVLKSWTALSDLNALSRALESKRFSEHLDPVVLQCPEGRRILVLAPHPDDDVFSSGGTLLHARAQGASVTVVYLTSGENPSHGAGGGLTEKARRRIEEARAVAERFGTTIECWEHPARAFPIDIDTIERLRCTIATVRPDVIFLPFIADDHIDHRRTAALWYAACRNGEWDGEVWAYQVYSTLLSNVLVDITDVIVEKEQMVRMWSSQMEKRDWAHYLRGLAAVNARFLKTNEPRYAEAFFVVPGFEYLTLCAQYFGEESGARTKDL